MKIIHVVLSLGKGGAEKLLVDVLPLYVEKGHDVSILQLSSIKESQEYIISVKKAGIKFFTLSNGSFRNVLLIKKLRTFFKKNHFDIIHVHLFPCVYWVALATLNMKSRSVLIFTEHSSQNRRNAKFYMRPIERFMYGRYDRIVAISEKIKEKLDQWLGLSEKIVLIPNGVNQSKFRNAKSYPPSFWYERMNLRADYYTILMVARFSPPKDHITVIEALEMLPSNYQLVFVGDGENQGAIRNLVAEKKLSNSVYFAGFRLDIPELMKSADLIVLSSLYEGLSGVTLEALASGTVFLGTDVAGIREVVPNRSFLFTKRDSLHLAQKIKEVTKNDSLRRKMISEGLDHVKNYSVASMVENHLTEYEQLLHMKNS